MNYKTGFIYVLCIWIFIQAAKGDSSDESSEEEEKQRKGKKTTDLYILEKPLLVENNKLLLKWTKTGYDEVPSCKGISITYFYINLACPNGTRALSRTINTKNCQDSYAYLNTDDNYKILNISLRIDDGNYNLQTFKFPDFVKKTTTLTGVWKQAVENLTAVYKDRKIVLRWRLYKNLDCLPREYRVYYGKNFVNLNNWRSLNGEHTWQLAIYNQELWRAPIKLFAFNYYADDRKFSDYIEQVKKNPDYYAITNLSIFPPSIPADPFNINVNWTNEQSSTVLNIWWEYEDTEVELEKFTIRVNINDNRIRSAYVSYKENKTHYYVDIPIDEKLIKLEVFISIRSIDNQTSKEITTNAPIPPAKPKFYFTNNIRISGKNLSIQKPFNETFSSSFFIYKSEWDKSKKFEMELDDDIEIIKRSVTTDEKAVRLKHLSKLEPYSNPVDDNFIFDGTKYMTPGKNYIIAMFIVNTLNEIRVVDFYKKIIYNICPPEGKSTMEDPQDCRQFFMCSDGNAIKQKCPNGTIFNLKSAQCDLELDKGCNQTKKRLHRGESNWKIIIVVIISAVIFVILAMIIPVYRCLRKNNIFGRRNASDDIFLIYSPKETCSVDDYTLDEYQQFDGQNLKPTNNAPIEYSKPIKIQKIRDYVKQAVEGPELLRQHQLFSKVDPNNSCIVGNLPINLAKNRFNNIIAYDDTRVKLIKVNEEDGSDYINANFITGYDLAQAYIATQGPKSNTVIDFWKMIWERDVKNIIMLTNLYDGKRKCCEKYLPDKGEVLVFGGISVEVCKETSTMTYIIRELDISKDTFTKKVTHIYFTAWPSHGQPLFPQTMVPLLQYMLTIGYSSKHPILVHCSAGVGRTGTVILCDICLRMCAAEGVVDWLAILAKLRTERPNMVDNIEQYKLAHLAVLACLTVRNTAIPCNKLFENEKVLKILFDDQMQYIKDNEWQDDAMKTVASVVQHVPMVEEKNRYEDILPDEVFQVFLSRLPDDDTSSCYINAIYVNSFMHPKRYVVTQHPLTNTIPDFWRLVIEQQITNIVNIDPVLENEQFWPTKNNEMQITKNMWLTHDKFDVYKETSIHEVIIWSNEGGDDQILLTVKVLSYNRVSINENNVKDFVSFIVECQQSVNSRAPILVTCHDGATSSGLFLAISNMFEQMKCEQVCDICQIIRNLRICRKQFFEDKDQLKVICHAALFYYNSYGQYYSIN